MTAWELSVLMDVRALARVRTTNWRRLMMTMHRTAPTDDDAPTADELRVLLQLVVEQAGWLPPTLSAAVSRELHVGDGRRATAGVEMRALLARVADEAGWLPPALSRAVARAV